MTLIFRFDVNVITNIAFNWTSISPDKWNNRLMSREFLYMAPHQTLGTHLAVFAVVPLAVVQPLYAGEWVGTASGIRLAGMQLSLDR